MTENWKSLKSIVECGDNYEISDKGRIKNIRGKILKPFVKKNGYIQITLNLKGAEKKYYIHRLVALAFITNPDKLPEVNHCNGDKNNNSIGNLEWVTRKENVSHSYYTGLKNQTGETNPMSLLKDDDIREIRRMYESGKYLQKEIARIYGVSNQTINNIIHKKSWKHVE